MAEIVDHLSDTLEDPKPPWKFRNEAYLAHLKALPAYDFGRKVSLSDIYEVKLGETAPVNEISVAASALG